MVVFHVAALVLHFSDEKCNSDEKFKRLLFISTRKMFCLFFGFLFFTNRHTRIRCLMMTRTHEMPQKKIVRCNLFLFLKCLRKTLKLGAICLCF